MNLRLLAAAIVLLAAYLAFGDFLTASTLSTPESFVGSIGRGIGSVISGVAASVGSIFNG